MREVSATEASRNFSAVLDAAERGETVVVTRAGEPVATIAPAPRANGQALQDVFARWASRAPDEADDAAHEEFARNVLDVREWASGELDGDPWRD